VGNSCALSLSWQIGHGRDRGIDYSDICLGSDKPTETNSYVSCSVTADEEMVVIQMVRGVSQTAGLKEKHREEKQSQLTS